MRQHPFEPEIPKNAKKLLVGTLPPEGVTFYFSNSSNTRLWDILKSVDENHSTISTGSNSLSKIEKQKILSNLKIGITDIILKYNRQEETTKDQHIIPYEYNKLLDLAVSKGINELFFVYKSAYKWFVHSLKNEPPVRLRNLKLKLDKGFQKEIEHRGQKIKLTILPPPLNRGMKGETLEFKIKYYSEYINGA